MVNRIIAGTIVLALLLVIGAVSYSCLTGSTGENIPEQPSVNTSGNETAAQNITPIPDEEDDTPLTDIPEQPSINTSGNETAARNITMMPDEEDDILLTEDTDLAAFAREQMNKIDIFQEELAGAVPGESVYVYSLDEERYDYYLIPFERDGYITVVAQVSIKGNYADFSSAYAPYVKTKDVVRPTLEEAKEFLSESGYDGDWDARLVWKFCMQTRSITSPLWEFSRDDGETLYIGHYPSDDKIHIFKELTEKTIAG